MKRFYFIKITYSNDNDTVVEYDVLKIDFTTQDLAEREICDYIDSIEARFWEETDGWDIDREWKEIPESDYIVLSNYL